MNSTNPTNSKALWIGVGGVLVLALLWAGYVSTRISVTLVINEQAYPINTHAKIVNEVIDEAGITLLSEDSVDPPLDTTLTDPQTITLQLARPITLQIDDKTQQLHSQQQTIAQILSQAKITITPWRGRELEDPVENSVKAIFRKGFFLDFINNFIVPNKNV